MSALFGTIIRRIPDFVCCRIVALSLYQLKWGRGSRESSKKTTKKSWPLQLLYHQRFALPRSKSIIREGSYFHQTTRGMYVVVGLKVNCSLAYLVGGRSYVIYCNSRPLL